MSHKVDRHAPRGWPLVLALATVPVILPPAARFLAGPPGALVHVRWQATIEQDARQRLQSQFRLADGERLDDSTWRYDLIDPSPANIRALISDPAVADTHHIDRPHYALAETAVRTTRRVRFAQLGSGIVAAADVLGVLGASLAILLTCALLSRRMPVLQRIRTRVDQLSTAALNGTGRLFGALADAARRIGRPLAPLALWVQRGVPEVDARTAGLFRIVFGATTLAFFAYPTHHVDASWLSTTFDTEVQGPVHEWVMEWLGQRPIVVDLVTPWVIAFGIAFVAGVFTRVTYALFVAGVLLWAYVAMSVESTHPHSTLVLTLVALLPSHWGDALSIDRWRQSRHNRPSADQTSRRYGYTIWIPILTFGVGFAAAAWAKLTVPPDGWTSWILNGSIKYHIISDVAGAPVNWGLQLVHHPLLAILASFGAIAIEALVVTAAFSRSERYRLAMGLAAAALFGGIGLLMGIAWPGWWIPLLAFLPWERWSRPIAPATHVTPPVSRPGRIAAGSLLTTAQLAIVLGVIGQQVVVSTLRLERAPMFSWYDMYSRSYVDRADFNASIPPRYQVVLAGERGRIQLRCNPHEEFVRDFDAALAGAVESRERVLRAIRGCGADLSWAESVTLEGNARTFDWDRLEFTPTHHVSLGPLATRDGDTPASAH